MEDNPKEWQNELLRAVLMLVNALVFCGIVFSILRKATGFSWLFLLPFLVCGLAILFKGILLFLSALKHKNGEYDFQWQWKGNRFFSNLYLVGFFIFWFGFLVIFDYLTITSGEFLMTLFTVPFWIVGVVVLIKKWNR